MNQVLKEDLTFVIFSLNYVDIIAWILPFIKHLTFKFIKKIKSSHDYFKFYDSLTFISSYFFVFKNVDFFYSRYTCNFDDFIDQKTEKKASKFLKQ